ncbi:hypothetical protein QBC37DRAFT_456149 [Rhypophila decipiens]|uniref:Uncharacterized protein n=1 Tax=Rhypophila decipiens TaxID=261697 RepID=A0AAN6XUS1_9PEZI|nr:hypothetical protein QBC37DRAFT_456149 [Rhypophila decipiens]
MSSIRAPEIFRPLGTIHVYLLPNLEHIAMPECLRIAPSQPFRQPDEAAQWAILRMGHVTNSLLHSDGYIERIILYLPGCISPAVYETRLGILRRNMISAPRMLGMAIEQGDWNLCRHTAQDQLIPSCLQLVMNGVWKDSFTRTAAAIVPELHATFDAELNIVIAELIRKCEAALEIGPGRQPPVDVFFDRYLVRLATQFVVHGLNGETNA